MPDLTAKHFCSADGRFDVVLEPAALDAMIAAWGASEDELIEEYQEIRRVSREKKRNVK